jgi:hypothetical protein
MSLRSIARRRPHPKATRSRGGAGRGGAGRGGMIACVAQRSLDRRGLTQPIVAHGLPLGTAVVNCECEVLIPMDQAVAERSAHHQDQGVSLESRLMAACGTSW